MEAVSLIIFHHDLEPISITVEALLITFFSILLILKQGIRATSRILRKSVQIISARMLFHFSKSRLKPYSALGVALVKFHNKGRDRNFGLGPEEIFFDETGNRFGIDCNFGIKYHFTPAWALGSELGSNP